MQTTHRLFFQDSSTLDEIEPGSINLVVTSPPYPMIEMWDTVFSQAEPSIADCLAEGRGEEAFEQMHQQLDRIWARLAVVMAEGALACINIGDAVRSLNQRFRLYPNHARIINAFSELGLETLPLIIWRKQTNAPNKFMGSGMLPAGAYVTLEHEYILIFRKGRRIFKTQEEKENRRKSALFWEERNNWYSDQWEFKGARQGSISGKEQRRFAAYPLELPFRLINMFSVYGDTVFDPFLGTGTTTMAAVAAARNSVGCEQNPQFRPLIEERVISDALSLNDLNLKRLDAHRIFVENRLLSGKSFSHHNSIYDFSVITAQEKDLLLYSPESIHMEPDASFKVFHQPLL